MASAGGGWPGERHAGGVANRARCLFCGSATGPFVEPDWLFRARACMACQPGHRVGQGSKRLDHEQPKHRLMQVCVCASAPVRIALPEGGGWRVLGGEARRPAGGRMCGPGDCVALASLVRLHSGGSFEPRSPRRRWPAAQGRNGTRRQTLGLGRRSAYLAGGQGAFRGCWAALGGDGKQVPSRCSGRAGPSRAPWRPSWRSAPGSRTARSGAQPRAAWRPGHPWRCRGCRPSSSACWGAVEASASATATTTAIGWRRSSATR
jgi:hypothetical protein